ncbi:MAG: flavin reductase family protein [Chloroflexi bacterium]|nr:flavin reductase family protein [Chloroflexota bacterium]
MQLRPDEGNWRTVYKLMIGAIVPRPIGWISTVDSSGRPNLAPFSFFNAVCSNPAHLLFCPSVRSTDLGQKDTLHNVRATGEFVVNIVTEDLAEAMNTTATEFPRETNEFDVAGLTPIPSDSVRAPRVAESPINFECKVAQIIEIGNQPGGGSIVIGKVLMIHVAEDVLFGGDKIDPLKLHPIGRMAGTTYTHVNDLFEMVRAPSQIRPKD